jgi:hypothetical protein
MTDTAGPDGCPTLTITENQEAFEANPGNVSGIGIGDPPMRTMTIMAMALAANLLLSAGATYVQGAIAGHAAFTLGQNE